MVLPEETHPPAEQAAELAKVIPLHPEIVEESLPPVVSAEIVTDEDNGLFEMILRASLEEETPRGTLVVPSTNPDTVVVLTTPDDSPEEPEEMKGNESVAPAAPGNPELSEPEPEPIVLPPIDFDSKLGYCIFDIADRYEGIITHKKINDLIMKLQRAGEFSKLPKPINSSPRTGKRENGQVTTFYRGPMLRRIVDRVEEYILNIQD